MKLIWILVLILGVISGTYCFWAYKNSKFRTYLLGTICSVAVVSLESMALLLS